MAFEIPEQVKPVADFAVQVVLGAAGFLVVFLAAVIISAVVKALESTGVVPAWVVIGGEYAEMGLFGLDLFCFGSFVVIETIKLLRGLWRTLWQT